MSSNTTEKPKAQQKHKHTGYRNYKKDNPKKGGPGIMITCETGRERKCQQEGLDILNYYVRDHNATETEAKCDSTKSLSLDDEIKELKGTDKSEQAHFSVYDARMRGMIMFLCTMPDCAIIPPFTKNNKKEVDELDECRKSNNEPAAKKQKLEDEKKTDARSLPAPIWDPIETVRLIIKDLQDGVATAPSSRFVTRMIPLQVSCTTNEDEIEYFARKLFSKYNTGTAATFSIRPKRRLCTSLKSSELITMIAKLAPKNWKVNLVDPKYTLIIEVCKTFCGMSIIENMKEYGNFNLVEAREKGDNCKKNET